MIVGRVTFHNHDGCGSFEETVIVCNAVDEKEEKVIVAGTLDDVVGERW